MAHSILDFNREIVLNDYQSAVVKNKEAFLNGDLKVSNEYIFDNQKEDASIICNKFYKTDIRAISIVKRTKVGMDGLMIEIAKNMTTHPDNNFALHRDNIFFITAMSNVSWEIDMKEKLPSCFKDNVYHHGKLQRLKEKFKNIKNALIINDEIDNGDKEGQKLHNLLKESVVLDINYIKEKNIRFVFVSATMINELHELCKWGDIHYTYYMNIPDNYIGHKDFLELNIIQEYYPIIDDESAEKWIQEDIIENYGLDYRVHIIRTDEKNKKFISEACIRNNIDFKNHTSDNRISGDILANIFNNISNHLIIAIKGFYRRANLIPNAWKKKIGATHERYVKNYDTNVQVQGLPGRMSGYWKYDIINGHKTGPHRTSLNAIKEYEDFYNNPFGNIKYNTSGSKKSFVNVKNIKNLEVIHEITNKRIPIIFTGLNKTDIIFTSSNKVEKINFIKSILKDNSTYEKLYNFIINPIVECSKISQPIKNKSYHRHIITLINSSKKNTAVSLDLEEKYKNKNNWQVFIDNRENRLCFVVWSLDQTLF